jgi:cytochrome c553
MGRLKAYKAGETIGAQSSMMWGNASRLSDEEIHQVTEYIETL